MLRMLWVKKRASQSCEIDRKQQKSGQTHPGRGRPCQKLKRKDSDKMHGLYNGFKRPNYT